jgi:hypothetical protein
MGLGYYVLPDLSGKKYEGLRTRHKELVDAALKFVKTDRKIIADYDVGKQLMEENIKSAIKQVRRTLR